MGGPIFDSLRRHAVFLPVLLGALVMAISPTVLAMRSPDQFTGAGPRAVHATAHLAGRPAPTPRPGEVVARGTTAVLPKPAQPAAAPTAVPDTIGHDVSYPQCDTGMPSGSAFMIIGLNGGRPFTLNPCFFDQYLGASPRPHAIYINTAYPLVLANRLTTACGNTAPRGLDSGATSAWVIGCSEAEADLAAVNTLPRELRPSEWWLDVEVGNAWDDNQVANQWVIRGVIDRLQRDGLAVGIYSAVFMWNQVVSEGWAPPERNVPEWVAGPGGRGDAAGWCGAPFGPGAIVKLVQFPHNGFDANLLCPH